MVLTNASKLQNLLGSERFSNFMKECAKVADMMKKESKLPDGGGMIQFKIAGTNTILTAIFNWMSKEEFTLIFYDFLILHEEGEPTTALDDAYKTLLEIKDEAGFHFMDMVGDTTSLPII